MAIVARYVWGKTEKGYGWNAWEGCGLSIEQIGHSGMWAVYEADGSQLCVCTSYKGAQRVVARLQQAALTWFDARRYEDMAFLEQGKDGVTYHAFQWHPDPHHGNGDTFPTLRKAKAFVRSKEHTVSNGLPRS
jgi:hypothetical protein